MPRPSFSDNPLLRVSRPVSACSRCRSAKVKCDGKLPACTACEKAGRASECSSANDQFARGKERSYVAALELRIEKLSRRLDYARSRKASVAQHDPEVTSVGTARDRNNSLARIKAAIHSKAARQRENSDVNSLVSDFGFLSVNAATRDFEPSSTNMTFARVVLAAAINDPLPLHHPSSFPASDPTFPPRQAALATFRFYMQNIYVLFPCFSETTLLATLENVYQEDDRPVQPADRSMLYLVLAIGFAAQSRRSGDEMHETAVRCVSRALVHADRALAPGHVSQIQCLILLTQYAMLDPAHFDSWHLIGFAARATIDLGFHQDLPLQSVPDKATLDMRRRIFYCVYSLDRSISMVHARAFSFTDNAINVALPSASSAIHSPLTPSLTLPSPDPALLHFQLRRLQSESYLELFQSDPAQPLTPDGSDGVASAHSWHACRQLWEWSENLPADLEPGVRGLFDLELRYSYVYCVAPSTRAPRLTDHARVLIFEHTLAYLEAVHAVAHSAVSNAFYTYHDALKVYFMASQLVAVLRDAEDALLSGAPPPPVPMPPPHATGGGGRGGILALPPPPLPPPRTVMPGETNLDRSLRCLEGVPQTLRQWGQRWADATSLLGSFESVITEMAKGLTLRKAVEEVIVKREPQESNMGLMSPMSPLHAQTGVVHGPPTSPSRGQAGPQHGHGNQHQHSLSPTHLQQLHGLSPSHSLSPSHAVSPRSPLSPLSPRPQGSPQSVQTPVVHSQPGGHGIPQQMQWLDVGMGIVAPATAPGSGTGSVQRQGHSQAPSGVAITGTAGDVEGLYGKPDRTLGNQGRS